MSNSSTIKSLLNSNDTRVIKRALSILDNKFQPELEDDVRTLMKHSNKTIQSYATKIHTRYLSEAGAEDSGPVAGLENFVVKFKKQTDDQRKCQLLQELNDYSLGEGDEEFRAELTIMCLNEKDRTLVHHFIKMLIRVFGEEQIEKQVIRWLSSRNNNILTNCVIAVLHFESQKSLEKIVEIYESAESPEFIYFSSIYLWKYSKLLVISKLRGMVQGDENSRILTAKVCVALSQKELSGIVNYLMEDPLESVRAKARIAYDSLEKNTSVQKSEKETVAQDPGEVADKFKATLLESSDFQEKVMIVKILDNLGMAEFVPLLRQLLLYENNVFMIASYVKFIGKYGRNDCIDFLVTFLDLKDNRVIANCLEGLAFCSREERLTAIFKNHIKHKDHRISSVSAMGLWKFGEKAIVTEYLKHLTKSSKHWKKIAALRIIEFLKDPELKEFVIDLSKDKHKEIRETSLEILKTTEKLEPQDEISPMELVDYLIQHGRIPDPIVMKQIRIIQSDKARISQKISSANALAFIAGDRHFKQIYRLYTGAEDANLKAALVHSIACIFSGGVQFLLDTLKRESEPRIIISALDTFSLFDYSSHVDEIFPFLYNEHPRIVASAIRLLYEIIPEEILKKVNSMADSSDPVMRRNALYSLNSIRTYECYLRARKMLTDDKLDIAIVASEIIAEMEENTDFKIQLSEQIIANMEEPAEEGIDLESLDNYLMQISNNRYSDIPEIVSCIKKVLDESNALKLVRFLRNHEKFSGFFQLMTCLSGYMDLEEVFEFVESFIVREDIPVGQMIPLLKEVDQGYFSNILLDRLNRCDQSTGHGIVKLFLENPAYGLQLNSYIESRDSRGKIFVEFLLKCYPELQQTKPDMPALQKDSVKPAMSSWTPATPKTRIETRKADEGSPVSLAPKAMIVIGVLMIAGIFILFLTRLEFGPLKKPKVKQMASELPRIENKSLVEINTSMAEILKRSSLGEEEKRSQLLKILSQLETRYFSGELYRAKKLLISNKLDDALREMEFVRKNIEQGKVIENFHTGKWGVPGSQAN